MKYVIKSRTMGKEDITKGRGPDIQPRKRRLLIGDSVRFASTKDWHGEWVPKEHRATVTKVDGERVTVKNRKGVEKDYHHNDWVVEKGRGPDIQPRKKRFTVGSEVDRDVPLKDHPWKRGEVTHVMPHVNPDKVKYKVKWGNGSHEWHSGHKLKESEI